tara:strand:- start:57 stop:902 length:846 start_codon:yes stop_codon:yes gene_type:complete
MLPRLPNINLENKLSPKKETDLSIKPKNESSSVESLPNLGIAERFMINSLSGSSPSSLGNISPKVNNFSSSQSLPPLMKTTNSSAFTSRESGLSDLSEHRKEGFFPLGDFLAKNDVSLPKFISRLDSPSPLSLSDFSNITSRADTPIDASSLKFENFSLILGIDYNDLMSVLNVLLENEDDSPDVTIQKCNDFLDTYNKFIDYDLFKLKDIQSSLNLSNKNLIGFSIYLLYSVLDERAYNLEDFNEVFLKFNKSDLGSYYDFQVQVLKMEYATKLLAGGMG